MPLNGTIVSMTENYAFLDAGVMRDTGPAGGKSKPKRINGRLYRLDMLEKYAISSKYKGADTQAVLEKGMDLKVCMYRRRHLVIIIRWEQGRPATSSSSHHLGLSFAFLQVYVKGIHRASGQYSLTIDPEINEEKAEILKRERSERFTAMKKKQDVKDLLIGESRKGVITKVGR